MTKNKSMTVGANRSLGDKAVDGLLPGLTGGLLMIAYLVVAGLLNGVQPLETFGYFLPYTSLPPIAGLASHFAVSAVYGMLFGLIAAAIGRRRPNWLPIRLAGMLYALALWLAAWLVIVPSGLSGLGSIPTAHLLAAHLLYGWGTGRILSRSRS